MNTHGDTNPANEPNVDDLIDLMHNTLTSTGSVTFESDIEDRLITKDNCMQQAIEDFMNENEGDLFNKVANYHNLGDQLSIDSHKIMNERFDEAVKDFKDELEEMV